MASPSVHDLAALLATATAACTAQFCASCPECVANRLADGAVAPAPPASDAIDALRACLDHLLRSDARGGKSAFSKTIKLLALTLEPLHPIPLTSLLCCTAEADLQLSTLLCRASTPRTRRSENLELLHAHERLSLLRCMRNSVLRDSGTCSSMLESMIDVYGLASPHAHAMLAADDALRGACGQLVATLLLCIRQRCDSHDDAKLAFLLHRLHATVGGDAHAAPFTLSCDAALDVQRRIARHVSISFAETLMGTLCGGETGAACRLEMAAIIASEASRRNRNTDAARLHTLARPEGGRTVDARVAMARIIPSHAVPAELAVGAAMLSRRTDADAEDGEGAESMRSAAAAALGLRTQDGSAYAMEVPADYALRVLHACVDERQLKLAFVYAGVDAALLSELVRCCARVGEVSAARALLQGAQTRLSLHPAAAAAFDVELLTSEIDLCQQQMLSRGGMSASATAAAAARTWTPRLPIKMEHTACIDAMDHVCVCVVHDAASLDDCEAHVRVAAARGLQAPLVAIDSEWRPDSRYDTRAPGCAGVHWPTSVLQLAVADGAAFVLDLLALMRVDAADGTSARTCAFLHWLLCSDDCVKVGFGPEGDIARLLASYPEILAAEPHEPTIANVEATTFARGVVDVREFAVTCVSTGMQTASLQAGVNASRTLTALVAAVCGPSLDKTQQTSDWQVRPLSSEQITYAVHDALCVLDVAQTLQARMDAASGQIAAVLSACTRTIEVPRRAPIPAHLRTPYHGDTQLAVPVAAEILPHECVAAVLKNETLGTRAVAAILARHGLRLSDHLVAVTRADSSEQTHATLTAADGAAALAVPVACVIKTLAMLAGERPIIALVPGVCKVDLRKLAVAAGVPRHQVRMATSDECVEVFGYVPGTFPPVGFKSPVRVFIDSPSVAGSLGAPPSNDDWLYTGSGDTAFMLRLTYAQLCACSQAAEASYCRTKGEAAEPPPSSSSSLRATGTSNDGLVLGEDDIFARPRFLVDSMLGRLTRWLRVIGVDTETITAREVHELAEQVRNSGRILITRDRKLLARKEVVTLFFVTGNDTPTQFDEVSRHFGITVREEDLMSRCAKCNGDGYDRLSSEEAAAPEYGVPGKVLLSVTVFWRCRRCAKLYWEGPKHADTRERFTALMEQQHMMAAAEGVHASEALSDAERTLAVARMPQAVSISAAAALTMTPAPEAARKGDL